MIAVSKLPATIASRYLPVRLIGKGGMGVVYEVVHARTGEHLALKVLQTSAGAPAEALERFKREARAPAQIKSENVVHVSDADVAPELDGAPFLVMELLEGMDLEQAASRSKPDRATVVGWLRQIAPALDKAHRLGIIHRDLKPENLFLATVEGRPPLVKILDFGIAKMAEEGSAATTSGQVLGTPKYMAPEQAARHSSVTPAIDRYALGLVAYRLIVGESYYRGNVMSILAELLHGLPSAPSARDPSLGDAFDAWFMQACHREPEQRFASASEQVEALAVALGLPQRPSEAPREHGRDSSSSLDNDAALQPTLRSDRLRLQNRSKLWLLALAALLLAGAAVTLAYRDSSDDRNNALTTPATPAAPPAAEPSVARVGVTFDPPPRPEPNGAAEVPAPTPILEAPAAAARALGKARPRPSRVEAIAAPPPVPSPDPFKDQK